MVFRWGSRLPQPIAFQQLYIAKQRKDSQVRSYGKVVQEKRTIGYIRFFTWEMSVRAKANSHAQMIETAEKEAEEQW